MDLASGSNYKVAFRRRREGKTDYATRAKLVGVDKSRLVVRISNANCIVQVVNVGKDGDETVVSAHSKELNKLGWLAGNKNTSAVYLTAYLCGKKAVAAGIDYAVADIGLKSPIRGSKVFAAVKGAADAGLNVPYGESIIPSEDSLGKNIGVVAISFSSASSQPRDQTYTSCIGRQILYHRAIWKGPGYCS